MASVTDMTCLLWKMSSAPTLTTTSYAILGLLAVKP
jgi:hypothetical protein